MTKNFIIILSFIATSNLFGQVDKIKINRIDFSDSTTCDFKFTADTSLINKTLRLEKFAFKCVDKMSNKTVEEIRTKLGRPSREKQYYVSKLAVADFVKNACSVNKFALQEVEIKQGTDLGHIVIVFTYLKLKKP